MFSYVNLLDKTIKPTFFYIALNYVHIWEKEKNI